ncbi:hypothetical protein J0H58_32880, partial [bacterium]|nr:hypothetical protein [bacterium]
SGGSWADATGAPAARATDTSAMRESGMTTFRLGRVRWVGMVPAKAIPYGTRGGRPDSDVRW